MHSPKVWSNLWHFLAFGLGSGLAKKAPGTWGTLVGLVFVPFAVLPLWWPIGLRGQVWLCGRVAADLGVHDHGGIVWDEFVGIWITLIFLPNTWLWWLLGFVVFRLLDIAKPWPISVLDRNVTGGFGIMIDDMLAGVIAAAVLYAAWFFTL